MKEYEGEHRKEDQGLWIGNTKTGKFELPVDILKKHVAIFGTTGSGKTVAGKCIIEESVMKGIPSLLIDTQGDLASMCLQQENAILSEKGIPISLGEYFREKAEIRVFTPASDRGIPICINPFLKPQTHMPKVEMNQFLDVTSSGIIGLLGYNEDRSEGKAAKMVIYEILEETLKGDVYVGNFEELALLIEQPPSRIKSIKSTFSKKQLEKLARNIKYLSIGLNELLFSYGTPIDMNIFLKPVEEGKIPINIIYLNTLMSENYKQFFVTMIGREIYNWMLRNPSNDPQFVFYMDEVSTYLPPHPYSPPAKNILKLLWKQGRKYGVSSVMSTQNIADVDYKAMGQAGTLLLGKLDEHDIKKIGPLLKATTFSYEEIMNKLRILNPLEFVAISSDIFDEPQSFQVRWLLTEHRVVEEDELKNIMPPYITDYFANKYPIEDSQGKTREEVAPAEELSPPVDIEIPEVSEDEILAFELNYPQNLAVKVAKRSCRTGLMKKLKVNNVEFSYLPLWQARCNIGSDKSMLLGIEKAFRDLGMDKFLPIQLSSTAERFIYVNALNNRILLIQRDSLTFSDIVSNNIFWLRGIEKFASLSALKKSTVETEIQKPKINEKQARKKVFRTFGIHPEDMKLVLLPIWTFSMEIEETEQWDWK